jgi:hypothetical protein
MKKKRKAYIDVYKSMYPLELVVVNGSVTLEQLRKQYCEIDGTEIEDFNRTRWNAVTFKGIRKSDEHRVVIVWLQNPEDVYYTKGSSKIYKDITYAGVISHEAAHVALTTYDTVGEGICTVDQEPFAYYLQWIVECIYKTMSKK